MNVYLGGPMRGYPGFNFPAFLRAERDLTALGHSVYNPAARDIAKHGPDVANSPTGNLDDIKDTGFSLRESMLADVQYICREADAVALLPGWIFSKGAFAEYALARALGLKIFALEKNENGRYEMHPLDMD